MYYLISTFYLFSFYILSTLGINSQLLYVEEPRLIQQTQSSLSLSWESNISSDGYYRYEIYPKQIDNQSELLPCEGKMNTTHRAELTNLESNRFIRFQSMNVVEDDTIYSQEQIFSLASTSTGEIQIFFNNSVKESVSNGARPNGVTTAEMESEIISKINNATTSIDYCLYNTHRESIVDALKAATDRGVVVRVIYNEKEESSNYLFGGNLPFSAVERLGDGLMHNKFLIIDADDEDGSWIMSGSTNFTDNQMDVDPNHTIFIQDKNLAQAYEIEFEEMWGSDGPTPNADNAKFGKFKSDNTPHEFMVGGKRIELYFSPSDNVSSKINKAILSAESNIDAALLIFTKWETRDVLLDEMNTGTKFRAIIEDQNNSDEIIASLKAQGADILEHPLGPQMHHKYAIIDAASQNDNSKVISGSHNWTHSADIRHDENLLIIHDPDVANIFQQEFEARWAELRTAVIDLELVDELSLYPNPAIDFVRVRLEKSVSSFKILDIRGALMQVVGAEQGKEEQLLNISHLDDGTYFVVGYSDNSISSIGTFIKSR